MDMWRRRFQAEGTLSAKALWHEWAWPVQEAAVCLERSEQKGWVGCGGAVWIERH